MMEAARTPGSHTNKKLKILIVDDDSDSRYMLRFLLEKEHHHIFEATDGELGLEKFSEVIPDIVITDIVMPKKEGITLIKELRERTPRLPVIAITSDVHGRAKEFLELSKQIGATTVLEKPITQDSLSAALFEASQFME